MGEGQPAREHARMTNAHAPDTCTLSSDPNGGEIPASPLARKEKEPRRTPFGRSGTARGMAVPARRVERKDTGLLAVSIIPILSCVKNILDKEFAVARSTQALRYAVLLLAIRLLSLAARTCGCMSIPMCGELSLHDRFLSKWRKRRAADTIGSIGNRR